MCAAKGMLETQSGGNVQNGVDHICPHFREFSTDFLPMFSELTMVPHENTVCNMHGQADVPE